MKLDAIQILDDMNKEFGNIGRCEVLLRSVRNNSWVEIRLSVINSVNYAHNVQFAISNEFLKEDNPTTASYLNSEFRANYYKLRRLINYGF